MSEEERGRWLKRLKAIGISDDDAEDMLQDALVKAFDYLCRQHPDADSEAIERLLTDAFLKQVIKCHVIDFFRTKNRELKFLHEYIANCQLLSPDEDDWWTLQAAYEVLNRLPECWQKVAQWQVQGYSWQEIATLTGKPVGTLAPGLERAIDVACENLSYSRKKKQSLIFTYF